MSARAQDVTSKLLLDGRAANTVNLPTRPPLACLPVSLPLCLPPCLLALPVLCLPACLPATQTIFRPPRTLIRSPTTSVIYRSFFTIIIPLLFILVGDLTPWVFSSLHFYFHFFVIVPVVVVSYYARIIAVIGVIKSYWQVWKGKNVFPWNLKRNRAYGRSEKTRRFDPDFSTWP